MGPAHRRSRIGIALALVAAASLGTAAVAELFLRLARPVAYRDPGQRQPDYAWRELIHRPSAIPGLGYEVAPDRRQISHGALIRTNSHGMRDSEPLPDGTPGLWRIAVVGDSFTFGWGVAGEQTYPNVLERLLRVSPAFRGRTCDVLNLAVSGYSTAEEVLVVRHSALAWNPRLILVGYFLNDPEIDPIQPLQAYFAGTTWWQHSHLLRLAAQAGNRWKIQQLGGGDYYRYLHAEGYRKWRSVERGFRDLGQISADRGVPVIVVIFPELGIPRWEEYPYRDLHAQVAQAAGAAGLGVLDLLDAFTAHEPKRLRLRARDPHPSPFGHRVAAEAILDKLTSDATRSLGR